MANGVVKRDDLARVLAAVMLAGGAGAGAALAQDEGQDYLPGGGEVIFVTASPLTTDPFDILQNTTALEGEEFERRRATTIGDMLADLPGIESTYFGPGAGRPVIRGMGGSRVRVLSNGLGTIDASINSADHAVAADVLPARRIEVIRGPSTLLYGSGALGGVVNVIDDRIPTEMPPGGFTAEALASYGTGLLDRSFAGSVTAGEGNFIFHASGFYRRTGDVRIPGFAESSYLRALEDHHDDDDDHDHDHDHDHDDDHDDEHERGRLRNSDVETKGGTLGFGYQFGRGRFGLSISRLESNYGVPGHFHAHDHDDDHDDDDDDHDHDHDHDHDDDQDDDHENVRVDLKQTRIDFGGSFDLNGFFSEARLRLAWADYEHAELEDGEVETVFANRGWEGRLELLQRPRNGFKGAYGVQFLTRDFSADGAEAFVPPTETVQVGLFGLQKFEMGDWHVEYGARYERQTVDAPSLGIKRSFNGFSASGGIAYHAGRDYLAGVTVSYNQRLPIAEELFSNGPHLATGAFEVGDPTLDKEEGTTVELTLRRGTGRLTGSINLFYTDFSNYIFLTPTGEEDHGLPVFAYMQDSAKFYGGEISARLHAFDWGSHALYLDASADMTRASTAGGNLPRIPPVSVLGGVEWLAPLWSARVETKWVDSQRRLAEFELPTDGYTLVNAHFSIRPFAQLENVSLALSARNIFNQEARSHVSPLKDRAPLPGRDIRFSIRASL
jgi:iron complex outermembrane receptor protein